MKKKEQIHLNKQAYPSFLNKKNRPRYINVSHGFKNRSTGVLRIWFLKIVKPLNNLCFLKNLGD
jgi:hypothetical protein